MDRVKFAKKAEYKAINWPMPVDVGSQLVRFGKLIDESDQTDDTSVGVAIGSFVRTLNFHYIQVTID